MSEDQSEQWFSGSDGRTDEERRYLDQVRALAASWDEPGLTAAMTQSVEMRPLYIGVDVPSLPVGRRVLQVWYWGAGVLSRGLPTPALQGCWGGTALMDDYSGDDPDCLTVIGVQGAPEQFAEWAAAWVWQQLRRPVAQEEWVRRGKVVGERWRLDDDGEGLYRRGAGWWRSTPGTSVRLRRVRNGPPQRH